LRLTPVMRVSKASRARHETQCVGNALTVRDERLWRWRQAHRALDETHNVASATLVEGLDGPGLEGGDVVGHPDAPRSAWRGCDVDVSDECAARIAHVDGELVLVDRSKLATRNCNDAGTRTDRVEGQTAVIEDRGSRCGGVPPSRG